jgi:hypothetical protein
VEDGGVKGIVIVGMEGDIEGLIAFGEVSVELGLV